MSKDFNPEQLLTELPEEQLEELLGDPQLWCEAFLLEPKDRKPLQANHVQREILKPGSRFNVIRVHRRGGKSFAYAFLVLYYILTRSHCRVLLLCPAAPQVKEIFTVVRDFISANPWIEPHVRVDRESPQQRIELDNGSRIVGFTTGARSKSGGMSLRGQGAEVVLLDEAGFFDDGDWQAINPIMNGDQHQRQRGIKPVVYMASTPGPCHGFYYECCTSEEKKKEGWREVFIPVDQNPDWSPEDVAEARALSNDFDWQREWLVRFPEAGQTIFPRTLINSCLREISYSANLQAATKLSQQPGYRPPTRAIGVDWDKYNKEGRGSNISVLEARGGGVYVLVYREEIDPLPRQTHYTRAVQRVIELNELFQPEAIYVDKGAGDFQFETLLAKGNQDKASGLAQKTKQWQFGETIKTLLPKGGVMRRNFKQTGVALLRRWAEGNFLHIAAGDRVLQQEMEAFHVARETESGPVFADGNDHGLSSLLLAGMAFQLELKNPYAPTFATQARWAPAPVVVPRENTPEYWRGKGVPAVIYGPEAQPRGFSRAALGRAGPGKRSSF